MRIVITGANGFVGTHLVQHLSLQHDVVAVMRAPHPVPSGVKKLLIPSIGLLTEWEEALSGADIVVHLAARVHVMHGTLGDPMAAFHGVNVEGTEALANACVRAGVKRLVYLSSIKVNGEKTSDAPFVTHSAPAPVDPYGLSKWQAEQALRKVSDDTGLEIVILRPPVIYGVGVGGNIRRLMKLVQTGLPLPFGSIVNRRTMLSVENLCSWVDAALEIPQVPDFAVLIGDPEPISTKQLLRALSQHEGRRILMLPVPVLALQAVARIFFQGPAMARLVENLEISPSVELLPAVVPHLVPAMTALESFARQVTKEGSNE